ncbi:MAG: NAD-dependent epimerase [Anaerovorax sp.]|nr:NAD-dependent epimerase [Anaerovorax sp.]
MRILVTGAAGFIGFHLSKRLLTEGYEVIGYDNLNDYYDVNLKKSRLEILKKFENFTFMKADLEDKQSLDHVFEQYNPEYVINLAAQAGVRYSLENPRAYIDSNVIGFLNVLEACRNSRVKHLIYASSSSVYGGNKNLPFSTKDSVDHPISLYAATKKSNELMAHTYSHLFGIPSTGLRFFTVYGPYGRPDMALFLFTKAIVEGKPIKVFNYGKMVRDFTYVDDIVEGIIRVMKHIPKSDSEADKKGDSGRSAIAPYKVYNIGNNSPVELEHYIEVIEHCLGRKAQKEYLPLQAGDVPKTFADVNDLMNDVDFKPNTTVEEGISKFIKWYKEYYGI